MRRAYICDTAYQTFNMLNFHSHAGKDVSSDFFLCDYFESAVGLYRKIPEEFHFEHMVLFRPHEKEEHEGRIHWYFRHALSYLKPEITVRESIIEGNGDFTGYDEVFASTVTVFVSAMLQQNPGAKLFLIDEGVGGYSGDPVVGNLSWRQKLFSAVFRRGVSVARPECTYMYNVKNAARHTAFTVNQMPPLDEEFLSKARKVFELPDGIARTDRRIIWLTHPDAMERSTEALDRRLSEYLYSYRDRILVRKHPRDDRDDLYEAFTQDDGKRMWELMLPLLGMEDMTLLGTFSTAQMTPKLLYDLEPQVLFLCPYYREIYDPKQYDEIMDAIREFRELYREPSRVIFIEDLKELADYL